MYNRAADMQVIKQGKAAQMAECNAHMTTL
jgi:hypothetical protein